MQRKRTVIGVVAAALVVSATLVLGTAHAGSSAKIPLEKGYQWTGVLVSGNSASLTAHSKHVASVQWVSSGVVRVAFSTNIIDCAPTANVLAGQGSPGYAMVVAADNGGQVVRVDTARPDGTLENRSFYLMLACRP